MSNEPDSQCNDFEVSTHASISTQCSLFSCPVKTEVIFRCGQGLMLCEYSNPICFMSSITNAFPYKISNRAFCIVITLIYPYCPSTQIISVGSCDKNATWMHDLFSLANKSMNSCKITRVMFKVFNGILSVESPKWYLIMWEKKTYLNCFSLIQVTSLSKVRHPVYFKLAGFQDCSKKKVDLKSLSGAFIV